VEPIREYDRALCEELWDSESTQLLVWLRADVPIHDEMTARKENRVVSLELRWKKEMELTEPEEEEGEKKPDEDYEEVERVCHALCVCVCVFFWRWGKMVGVEVIPQSYVDRGQPATTSLAPGTVGLRSLWILNGTPLFPFPSRYSHS
jgi:hypothetical protein